MLLENEYPVRAFVRQDDERAEALRKAGAEVFAGDLLVGFALIVSWIATSLLPLFRSPCFLIDGQRNGICAPADDAPGLNTADCLARRTCPELLG